MPVRRVPIKGPFHGIITDQPPTFDPQGFEVLVNLLSRKGRIISRPGLDLANKFSAPDGNPVLNMTSFKDAENFLHTLALTKANPYMLTSVTGPPAITFNLLGFPTYINTLILNAKGVDYLVGDLVYIQQLGAQGGSLQVLAVDGGGGITAFQLLTRGSNYTAALNVPTSTPDNGSGATFDITVTTLASLGGVGSIGLPYAVVKAQNRVYFCNGSVPLCYTDGEAQFKIAGSVPGACRFLTANAGHMIGAVWTEPDPTQAQPIFYPNRVRWSDSGNFEQWDETDPASTAGLDDLVITPDDITGLTTIGNNSIIYRTNGISTMIPTGNSTIPFVIPNFSLAPKGEGCPYPYSLTSHNNIDRFIGNYEVWSFDGTNFAPLMDGRCNAEFFEDLNSAIGVVRGFITPVLDNGFQYLGYAIMLPGLNKAWVLNIAEGSWVVFEWAPPTGAATGSYDLQLIEQVYLT